MELFTFEQMKVWLRYPDDQHTEPHPVLLFLHGAGSRGNDTEVLKNNPFFTLTARHEDFPFVCVAPQCCENTWFDLWEQLKRLVQWIVTQPFADPDRIYVMGASMGGYATWQLAMSLPEVFAAAVPICGGGMYWNAGRLKHLPVWAFHGGKDGTVYPEESQKMVDAIHRNGGNARLTVYPENAHDAWSDTYRNPEVFAWLLSHQRGTAAVTKDGFVGSQTFG